MSYAKRVKGTYENEADVRRVMGYVSDLKKSEHLISGGNGIIGAEDLHGIAPECIARQFLAVQAMKPCRGRRIYHVVVSFERIFDGVTYRNIREVAEVVIKRYSAYQAIYAVHEDTYNIHLHFVFNNIPIGNYKNLSSYFNIIELRDLVDKEINEIFGISYMDKNMSISCDTI